MHENANECCLNVTAVCIHVGLTQRSLASKSAEFFLKKSTDLSKGTNESYTEDLEVKETKIYRLH